MKKIKLNPVDIIKSVWIKVEQSSFYEAFKNSKYNFLYSKLDPLNTEHRKGFRYENTDDSTKPKLIAEEPILFAIVPIANSKVGHAAMQYKNHVVNRLRYKMDVKPIFPRYKEKADFYVVYPSQAGIDTNLLMRVMDKVNVKNGGKYNFFHNNCAGSVDDVLKQVGVKDLDEYGPDSLGLTFKSPGNNPFGVGIEHWCKKHGTHVCADEIEQVYRYNIIANHEEIKADFDAKRLRYEQNVRHKKSITHQKDVATQKLVNLASNNLFVKQR